MKELSDKWENRLAGPLARDFAEELHAMTLNYLDQGLHPKIIRKILKIQAEWMKTQ